MYFEFELYQYKVSFIPKLLILFTNRKAIIIKEYYDYKLNKQDNLISIFFCRDKQRVYLKIRDFSRKNDSIRMIKHPSGYGYFPIPFPKHQLYQGIELIQNQWNNKGHTTIQYVGEN